MYSMILPFDTDHPEFIRGWECGEIWHTLRHLPGEATSYRRMVHSASLEMILRMAERLGWTLVEIPYDGDEFPNLEATLSEWALIELHRGATTDEQWVTDSDEAT